MSTSAFAKEVLIKEMKAHVQFKERKYLSKEQHQTRFLPDCFQGWSVKYHFIFIKLVTGYLHWSFQKKISKIFAFIQKSCNAENFYKIFQRLI